MQARARIIAVAETLFNKQGFDGATMRDIAAAAKMQPASVYYHFESKEALLWAVSEKGGIELLNRVSDAIALETDPWQRMQTTCVAHVIGLLDWRRASPVHYAPLALSGEHKRRGLSLFVMTVGGSIRLINDLPLRKASIGTEIGTQLDGGPSASL